VIAGFNETAALWDEWSSGMIRDSIPVFYAGLGGVRCVTDIINVSSTQYPLDPKNYVTEGDPPCYLDDPYEGELMVVLMDLFVNWTSYGYPEDERELMWYVLHQSRRSHDVHTTN
jgi:hypothetical protein